MNPVLVKILLYIGTSETIRKLVIQLLDGLSHQSDNQIDDEFVHALARALEIRIPEHTIPPDGNIFLGNEELQELKSERVSPKPETSERAKKSPRKKR